MRVLVLQCGILQSGELTSTRTARTGRRFPWETDNRDPTLSISGPGPEMHSCSVMRPSHDYPSPGCCRTGPQHARGSPRRRGPGQDGNQFASGDLERAGVWGHHRQVGCRAKGLPQAGTGMQWRASPRSSPASTLSPSRRPGEARRRCGSCWNVPGVAGHRLRRRRWLRQQRGTPRLPLRLAPCAAFRPGRGDRATTSRCGLNSGSPSSGALARSSPMAGCE